MKPSPVKTDSFPSGAVPARSPAAHVLLVDDNPLQLESQRLHLQAAGYRVSTAGNAGDALRSARHQRPDLLLSDVMMPDTDGFQLCRAMRRDPGTRSIPVVLISGHYGETLDLRHAARCGASMFVSRAGGPSAMVHAVREVLRRPGLRLEAGDDSTLDKEHTTRVSRQLDRLSQANAAVARRVGAQAAIIEQIGSTAEKMAGLVNAERLAEHLVGAGLAHVLVYRQAAGGALELADQAGCKEMAEQAGSLFGERPFFDRLVARNERMVLPSPAAPPGLLEAFRQKGFRSAALLPLACKLERFGLLIVLSAEGDLRNSDWAVFAKALAAQIGTILSLNGSQQQIKDSRKQLRAILNGIADGVFVTDGKFLVKDANRALSHITGYTLQEARGKAPLSFVPLPERTRLSAEISRYVEAGAYDNTVPFLHKDGSVRQAHFTGRRVRPDLYVNIVRDVTEELRKEKELERLAYSDPLTGLSNRTAFQHGLERAVVDAVGGGYSAGVLMLSLGNFREINDTLGPTGGDQVLCEAAARLQNTLAGTHTVNARVGAAQFGVLLPRVDDEQHLVRTGQALLSALAAPVTVDGIPIEVFPHLGSAQCPDDALMGSELLRRASVAMHHAQGQSLPYASYRPEQDPFSLQRLTLVSELRQAIAQDQLELWYQPKLDSRNGRVEAVEALVRWRHPHRGLVPPDEFIPTAERTGLIHLLTAWVLKAALRQAKKWQDQGLHLNVAINISLNDLREPSFQAQVLDALQVNGLSADSVTLEITESAAMQDSRRVSDALLELKRRGLRISLDDFGTGQASLAHLHCLPVDEIKLDKSFVLNLQDERSQAIARATVMLAREFGLKSVAEGVESAAHLRLLSEMGYDRIQGYHVSKPLPVAELETWLGKHRAAPAADGAHPTGTPCPS